MRYRHPWTRMTHKANWQFNVRPNEELYEMNPVIVNDLATTPYVAKVKPPEPSFKERFLKALSINSH